MNNSKLQAHLDIMSKKLYVIKRDGRKENIHFDKITSRIEKLCYNLNKDFIDVGEVAQKVISGIYPGVSTVELDTLAAEVCAQLSCSHPDYGILAARITTSNLHKETPKKFTEVIEMAYTAVSAVTGAPLSFISDELYAITKKYPDELNSVLIYDRDYQFSYFGMKTLMRNYLIKIPQGGSKDKIIERPQCMWLRVALGIHGEDITAAIETYHMLSNRLAIHASPTLFNAGSRYPGLSSCFLLALDEKLDSVDGIYKVFADCAKISKSSGGIGLSLHDLRAKGSLIHSSGGQAGGILPACRVLNDIMRHISQSGKRLGSAAVYLEPWHADIKDFLDLKKNTGADEIRARDLFYALWVPDLFMERVHSDGMWSLFCPKEAPGLANVYGKEFNALYTRYEEEKRYRKQVKARELWDHILSTQIETGLPYLLFKDHVNHKSPQMHLGTIRSSNLCCEIVLYTSKDETACCNLASLGLPSYVKDGKFDFDELHRVTKILVRNLNKVIDRTSYPTEESRYSNLKHRPIAIGVSGLHEVFMMLRLPWDAPESYQLNKLIFETIYFSALEESSKLAEVFGPYESFEGSPASKGILQFDMWEVKPEADLWKNQPCQFRPQWEKLKDQIKRVGLRNSTLTALMPTASTAQILNFTESFEPLTSCLYTRKTLSGEFIVINQHLLKELCDRGLWSDEIRDKLILNEGSVQSIPEIPKDLKDIYKSVWEVSIKSQMDMTRDRSIFIDMSCSSNLYLREPDFEKLTTAHFYAWKQGLKVSSYYVRSQSAIQALKFSVLVSESTPAPACSRDNPDCTSCQT